MFRPTVYALWAHKYYSFGLVNHLNVFQAWSNVNLDIRHSDFFRGLLFALELFTLLKNKKFPLYGLSQQPRRFRLVLFFQLCLLFPSVVLSGIETCVLGLEIMTQFQRCASQQAYFIDGYSLLLLQRCCC